MPIDPQAVSPYPAPVSRLQLKQMLAFMRLLYRLQRNPAYLELVEPQLPETARFDPGHDAVMMGYDFHLAEDGPKLIEVNTNAGGAMYAYFAAHRELIGKCPPPGPFPRRLLETFWRDWQRFSGQPDSRPQCIVIIDEEPAGQNLFPEMECCRSLFLREGIDCEIVDPRELQASSEGVFLNGDLVDFVYNRHCDFYLESDEMAGLRSAYLAGRVCLSPNPRAYGLLADKRRMILWSDLATMRACGLSGTELELMGQVVPHSRLLADLDLEQTWAGRKRNIFKPVGRYGGKGVLAGRSMSRTRFAAMPPEGTLVQELVPPSLTPGGDEEFKTDYRVYAYRDRAIGIAARLYRGQVTNLQTPGGGFARVELVD